MYYINDKNLSDFGITVQKFSGWEIPVKGNGDLVFDNAGFNGVEYLENEVKGPKTLILKCTMIGTTIQELDQFYLDLFDWLYTPGVLLLRVDYMAQTFNTFFVDGFTSEKLDFTTYRFDLKLRQYDIN
jgi:hypothetical protein